MTKNFSFFVQTIVNSRPQAIFALVKSTPPLKDVIVNFPEICRNTPNPLSQKSPKNYINKNFVKPIAPCL